ncbi:hypothetical protein [Georgenia sp. SUBG003]|uniref:hypothetical protein n=1 Tax=Georgenia sp. SUBG003 TaxID=1497974 RepID=UPI003AB433F4
MNVNRIRSGRSALTAVAAALALTLAACSSGGRDETSPTGGPTAGGGGEPQQITFLTHWGPEQVAQLRPAADGAGEDRAANHPGLAATGQMIVSHPAVVLVEASKEAAVVVVGRAGWAASPVRCWARSRRRSPLTRTGR